MKRAGLYVRVSTIEQKKHGLSVDSQIDALKKYCNDNGYEIITIYNDAGFSARKSYKHRPELLRMLDDCQKHKIDILLVTKLDRFFRSVPDYYACIERMDDVPWKTIWEDYETETSSGKFKVNIMLSIAQAESDRTGERIKAVNDYKRNNGQYVGGRAPIGYKIENKELVVDPDTQEAIQTFWDSYVQTMSYKKAYLKLVNDYGINLGQSRARAMVKNDTYAGMHQGYYPCFAYISRDNLNKIRTRRKEYVERHPVKNPVNTYIFRGLIKCPNCGGTYCAHTKMNGRGAKYKEYRCSSNATWYGCDFNKSIGEISLERYMLKHLEEAIEIYNSNLIYNQKDIIENEKKYKRLEAKLKRVFDLYEDGDITRSEYRQKRDNIKAEMDSLQLSMPVAIPSLPANWKELYKNLNDDHKQSFWASLIKNIEFYDRDNINIVLYPNLK